MFRVEKKHLNGMNNVHGGCFMSFADYCLFALASSVLQGPGVTVAFGCEFLDAAREGELIECEGEITRAGGSLIFLRGMLKSGERSLFTFSGTIKRVKWKPPVKVGRLRRRLWRARDELHERPPSRRIWLGLADKARLQDFLGCASRRHHFGTRRRLLSRRPEFHAVRSRARFGFVLGRLAHALADDA